MNFKELIKNIDIPAVIQQDSGSKIGVYHVLRELELDSYYDCSKADSQNRLFGAYLSAKYSTDTWVGLMVYVFDSEVVALSQQIGRKWDREFYWVSREQYNKVKEFCNSLLQQDADSITIIEYDKDIIDGYTLQFASELIDAYHKFHSSGTIDGESVTVVGDVHPIYYLSKTVMVQYSNGDLAITALEKLKFKYSFLKE